MKGESPGASPGNEVLHRRQLFTDSRTATSIRNLARTVTGRGIIGITIREVVMRIRWRDFELPIRVVHNTKTATPKYGEFIAEPFERGFGHTIGNSLRRVLISALEGYAVTSIKIDGVQHEFSTLPGVLEDVTDIILNIKKIRLSMKDQNFAELHIDTKQKGPVTANDIQGPDHVTIHSKNLIIANLTGTAEFKMELQAKRGRGYLSAEDNACEYEDLGTIPIASIFSPVTHVDYRVENTRVGKITNYDRLILTVTTDGTISPELALVEAAKILRKHLNPFTQYFELGSESAGEKESIENPAEKPDDKQAALVEKLGQPISTLKLGVRASNCLSSEGIRTMKDLVQRTENDLLKIRNFGKTSLTEIKAKLQKIDLSLGMTLDQ